MVAGNFTIKPVSAKLTRDTDTFSKMDPFCVIIIGNQKQTSSVHKAGGKFPQWSDAFSFKHTNEGLATIEVWDVDTASANDLVGSGALSLAKFFKGGPEVNEWVDITYKGKSAGQVLLSIQFFPASSG